MDTHPEDPSLIHGSRGSMRPRSTSPERKGNSPTPVILTDRDNPLEIPDTNSDGTDQHPGHDGILAGNAEGGVSEPRSTLLSTKHPGPISISSSYSSNQNALDLPGLQTKTLDGNQPRPISIRSSSSTTDHDNSLGQPDLQTRKRRRSQSVDSKTVRTWSSVNQARPPQDSAASENGKAEEAERDLDAREEEREEVKEEDEGVVTGNEYFANKM